MMRDAPSPFIDSFELKPYQEGMLSNLTFGVKDLIDIEGRVTGCGNPSWRESHPQAVANAVCIDQLLGAGAICKGKTISDELAFSLLGENFFYGTPLNPTAEDRVPGGSSSGSASAVAQGLVDFAIGTDTGGSVRVPASNCGIFGYRPSHDRISVAGVNPFAPSFDTVGVFTRDLDTLGKVMEVLVGESEGPLESFEVYHLQPAFDRCDREIQEAFSFDYPEKTLPELDLLATYCAIQWAEIWSTLGGWIEAEKPQLGPRTAQNFELAKNGNRQGMCHALFLREKFSRAVNHALGPDHFLCFPTTPSIPPKIGEIGDQRMIGDYYPRLLTQTALAGLARLPQITLPIGPVGLSLVGAQGSDLALLTVARSFLERHGKKAVHSSK